MLKSSVQLFGEREGRIASSLAKNNNRLLQFQTVLTFYSFSLTSETEVGSLFGLEGTVPNLRTKIMKHGREIKYRAPKMNGAAISHPNNCKYNLTELSNHTSKLKRKEKKPQGISKK